jgi:hypothetical protein
MTRRPLDWFSLVLGSTFMLVSLLFMADRAGWLNLDLAFVGPLVLIAFGIGSVCNGFRKRSEES